AQHDIGDDDSGNGAGSADQLGHGCRVSEREGKAANDAAEQIENEVLPSPKRPLDVITEHPEKDHVAEEVSKIGVKKLIRNKSQQRRHRSSGVGLSAQCCG